jgi:hypothetical protein
MKLWKGIAMVLEEQAKMNSPKQVSKVIQMPMQSPTVPHIHSPSSKFTIHEIQKELEFHKTDYVNNERVHREFKQSRVPSNQMSRIVQFTGLGMSVGLNSLSSYFKGENPLMNERNKTWSDVVDPG